MQMWQKEVNESQFSGSRSIADSPDKLLEYQDILESMQLLDEMYAATLDVCCRTLFVCEGAIVSEALC